MAPGSCYKLGVVWLLTNVDTMLSQQINSSCLLANLIFQVSLFLKINSFFKEYDSRDEAMVDKNPTANLNCFCFYLVYSKGRWCNVHVSIEEKVYLIINVSVVQWCNWCKSTAYRFLSQTSSCSFCYCNCPYFCQPKESIFIAVDLGQQPHWLEEQPSWPAGWCQTDWVAAEI